MKYDCQIYARVERSFSPCLLFFFAIPGAQSALLPAPSHMAPLGGEGPLTLHCGLEVGHGGENPIQGFLIRRERKESRA